MSVFWIWSTGRFLIAAVTTSPGERSTLEPPETAAAQAIDQIQATTLILSLVGSALILVSVPSSPWATDKLGLATDCIIANTPFFSPDAKTSACMRKGYTRIRILDRGEAMLSKDDGSDFINVPCLTVDAESAKLIHDA